MHPSPDAEAELSVSMSSFSSLSCACLSAFIFHMGSLNTCLKFKFGAWMCKIVLGKVQLETYWYPSYKKTGWVYESEVSGGEAAMKKGKWPFLSCVFTVRALICVFALSSNSLLFRKIRASFTELTDLLVQKLKILEHLSAHNFKLLSPLPKERY